MTVRKMSVTEEQKGEDVLADQRMTTTCDGYFS